MKRTRSFWSGWFALLLFATLAAGNLCSCGDGSSDSAGLTAPLTGSIKLTITNNDNNIITPQYSIDAGSWQNFVALAPGATADKIFPGFSAGEHQISIRWIEPQNNQSYNKGPLKQTVKNGEVTAWLFAIDRYVPPPPPPPANGTMKIRYANQDDDAISPQYSINGGAWQNFGSVAPGATAEVDLSVTPGSYTISSFYTDPDTSLGYTEGPTTNAVVAGQTTVWDFTIYQHLPPPPPPPANGTMIIRTVNLDNDTTTPRYAIDNGAFADFPTLDGFETKEISQPIPPGAHQVSLSWIDPSDNVIRNLGPVSQVVYSGLATVWTFTIPRNDPPPPPVKYQLEGFNFSAYKDGQNPNYSYRLTDAQILERLQIVAPYTRRIRTFGVGLGQDNTGRLARGLGLETYIGGWLARDLTANANEISTLIKIGQAGEADVLIVGSEVLLRGDLSEADLINYIRLVKTAVPGRPVAYADTYGQLLAHPAVIAEIDVIMVNYYPYWEGIAISQALASVHGWHQQIKAAAGSKPVVVSETGWPSAGNQLGNAVPSPANAAYYFLNFVSWARANNVKYFYFEAFDENWKKLYEGEVGGHWGVFDAYGVMKAGMQAVFDNQTMTDNWSADSMPGGPGTPSIEFTSVPPRGSSADLFGQVWHVKPADYKVTVYIYVPGAGWWVKPYFSSPKTTIQSDGRWYCDIATGGSDVWATQIAAFLFPNNYSPPLLSGSAALPANLFTDATAYIQVNR